MVIGGPVAVFPRDPNRQTAAEFHQSVRAFSQRRNVDELHFSVTANLITHKALFTEIGGFDSGLMSCGDYEWGRCVHGAGYRLIYNESVLMRHPARSSIRALLAKYARNVGGHYLISRARGTTVVQLALRFVDEEMSRCISFWRLGAEFSICQRAVLTAVESLVLMTKLSEVCRLALGGRPRRS